MKKTIEEILMKYNESDYDKIVLDYEGDIEEFEHQWDLQEAGVPMDEDATYKLRNRVLTLTVRG